MDNLHDLTIKSIEAHAKTEVRLASLELGISNIRADHKELVAGITEILKKLATMEEIQRHNEAEHLNIHRRITDVRRDLDEIVADHSPCKSLAKAAVENKDRHKDMERRITDLQNNCKNCPVSGYKDLLEQMEATKIILQMLVSSLNVVTYKIKGVPLWLLFVFLVIIDTAFLVVYNWEWLMKAASVVMK
jgi:predicted  nucleic acid-binding Zn-ribbon protein